ncbi:uncharacterized protein LOC133174211 [Saccostrea echinata]|uniref:uncharacterized protein LOC133174211 n=1 Tax=Saccostrea echinata TaxID=191078 RepID=UPI002A8157EF|nr:uncharacterized protein LOC133174211 [Saccostrea echinata]
MGASELAYEYVFGAFGLFLFTCIVLAWCWHKCGCNKERAQHTHGPEADSTLYIIRNEAPIDGFQRYDPTQTNPFDNNDPTQRGAFDYNYPTQRGVFDYNDPTQTDAFDYNDLSQTDAFDYTSCDQPQPPPYSFNETQAYHEEYFSDDMYTNPFYNQQWPLADSGQVT